MDDDERASAIRRGLLDPPETMPMDGNFTAIQHDHTYREVAPTAEETLWTHRVRESMAHGHRHSLATMRLFFLAMCVLFGAVVALIGQLHG